MSNSPDVHSPTTTRTIAIDRIATAIPLCPLDAGDNVEHARTRGEKRLANAADKRAHDEIRVPGGSEVNGSLTWNGK